MAHVYVACTTMAVYHDGAPPLSPHHVGAELSGRGPWWRTALEVAQQLHTCTLAAPRRRPATE